MTQGEDALVVELQGGVAAVGDEVGVVAVGHQTPLGGLQDDRGRRTPWSTPEFRVLVAGGDDATHEALRVLALGEGLGDLLLQAGRADEPDGVLGDFGGCVAHGKSVDVAGLFQLDDVGAETLGPLGGSPCRSGR